MPKYVLAYSGGLDTSVMLRWLQENHGATVVTVTADLGQKRELAGLREKALATGAARVFIDDLREEFVEEYIWPSLKAGALYQGVYPLATALGRPLIAKRAVEVAREVGADAIAHGCTGKGNDQVRLEVSVGALAPDLKCIAPFRDWELKTREQEIEWAQARGIRVEATARSPYSIDENLWGVAIEAGALEDPWLPPPDDCWRITTDPAMAPDGPAEVVVAFEEGTPVAVGGVRMAGAELIESLNEVAGAHGVGRLDVIEDRLVGIKSREVYEAPAAIVLHAAREALEQITLDRETRRLKAEMGQQLARLIYDGLWFTPLRRSIQAFVEEATRPVTGEVRMTLFKGQATAVGRRSPNALYDRALATYGAGDAFKHAAASGFIEIFGLGARTSNAEARRGFGAREAREAREAQAARKAAKAVKVHRAHEAPEVHGAQGAHEAPEAPAVHDLVKTLDVHETPSAREPRRARTAREAREPVEARYTQETRSAREPRVTLDAGVMPEVREPRGARNTRASAESRDAQDHRAGREPGEVREARRAGLQAKGSGRP